MYPSIKEVAACDDYILSVSFENGEKGRLDIKPMLDFGIFRRLKDDETFRRVRVSFDTIQWDCGADLDPEYVYKKCVKSGSGFAGFVLSLFLRLQLPYSV